MGPRKDEGAALETAIVTEEPFWRQIREEVREVQKKSLFCSMETFQLHFSFKPVVCTFSNETP